MKRVAIITSHPVQYNAPLFRELSTCNEISFKVFYSWKGTSESIDPEFEKKIVWDIPLLEDYDFEFVENTSTDPGTHHYMGLNNPGMIDAINNWSPNALLVYGWPFHTHLKVLRHFHNKTPIYFRGDSTLFTGGAFLRRIFRKLVLTWIYSHVDYVFYPGSNSKNYFLAHGVKESQLFHVPHSVDNDRFSNDEDHLEREALAYRNKLGIRQDSLVLLFAGKLVPRKSPELLLKSVVSIRAGNPDLDIHLFYAGTGPLEKKLKNQAKGKNFIHFLGFKNQSEMPLVYRMADILVLPSTIETWGLAVNEALASSRPVIVSDKVGCAPDLVKAGVTGEIFHTNNAKDLEKKILLLASNKNGLKNLRRSCKQFIERWSHKEAANRICSILVSQRS